MVHIKLNLTIECRIGISCADNIKFAGKTNIDSQIVSEAILEIPSSNGRQEGLPSTSKVEVAE